MTRDRILEAAAHEIEINGLTQFRVKRVAMEAGISVALLYSYFTDREDLIATTIVHRFREVLLSQANVWLPLRDAQTPTELRDALDIMIADAQDPARHEQRLSRIESMSFAQHNPTASAGIAAAKAEVSQLIYETVKPLEERNLFAPGISAVAFARIWYCLFSGQMTLEGEHALSKNDDDWYGALRVLAAAVVKTPADVSVK